MPLNGAGAGKAGVSNASTRMSTVPVTAVRGTAFPRRENASFATVGG